MIVGKRDDHSNFSDLILLKKEIENSKIVIKKIDVIDKAYKGNIEGMISINNSIVAPDFLAKLEIWRINIESK